jgi:hypothetical protein
MPRSDPQRTKACEADVELFVRESHWQERSGVGPVSVVRRLARRHLSREGKSTGAGASSKNSAVQRLRACMPEDEGDGANATERPPA